MAGAKRCARISWMDGKRPKLVPVSEEMKHLCALLAQELLQWPDVTVRPMFGLRAYLTFP